MPFSSSLDSPIVIKRIEEAHEIAQALQVERDVFAESGWVSMDEYEKYIPQSIFFGAFTIDGCVAMVRIVTNGPELPPFLQPQIAIEDRDVWEGRVRNGILWEFATAAVRADHRHLPLFLNLVREAYRYAHEQGIRYFGAIMDPRRAIAQNRLYQLYYRQIGPYQEYMGEPGVSAPCVMSFSEMDEKAERFNPEYLEWILEGATSDLRVRPPKPAIVTGPDVIDLREVSAS